MSLPFAADVAALVAGHLFMFGVAWHLLRLGLGQPAAPLVQVLDRDTPSEEGPSRAD